MEDIISKENNYPLLSGLHMLTDIIGVIKQRTSQKVFVNKVQNEEITVDSFGRDLAKDILIKIYTTLNDKYQSLSVIPREIDSYNKLDMAIENYGLYTS